MEVLLGESIGLSDSSIVSIRFGGTRRQARVDKVKLEPLKFPATSKTCWEPMKIEVMDMVSNARLVLRPNETRYSVNLYDTKDPERNCASVEVKLTNSPESKDTIQQERFEEEGGKEKIDDSDSAREYLETHGLVRYMQGLLHVVLRTRPQDPYRFIKEQLSSALPKANADEKPFPAPQVSPKLEEDTTLNQLEASKAAVPPTPDQVPFQEIKEDELQLEVEAMQLGVPKEARSQDEENMFQDGGLSQHVDVLASRDIKDEKFMKCVYDIEKPSTFPQDEGPAKDMPRPSGTHVQGGEVPEALTVYDVVVNDSHAVGEEQKMEEAAPLIASNMLIENISQAHEEAAKAVAPEPIPGMEETALIQEVEAGLLEVVPGPLEVAPAPPLVSLVPEAAMAEIGPAADLVVEEQAASILKQVAPIVEQPTLTTEEVSPAAQQVVPAAQQVALAVEQAVSAEESVSSGAEQIALAAEQAAPAAERVALAAEEVALIAEEVAPSAEQVVPAVKQVAPITEDVVLATQQVAPAAQQVAQQVVLGAQQDAPATEMVAPVVTQAAPTAEQVAPVTDKVVLAPEQVALAAVHAVPVAAEVPSIIEKVAPAPSQEQVAPTAQQVAPAAEPVPPEAEPVAPAAELGSLAAEQVAPAAEQVALAAEQIAPAAEQVEPATVQVAVAVEQVAGEQVAPMVEQSLPAADQCSPAREQVSPPGQQIAAAVEPVMPTAELVLLTGVQEALLHDEIAPGLATIVSPQADIAESTADIAPALHTPMPAEVTAPATGAPPTAMVELATAVVEEVQNQFDSFMQKAEEPTQSQLPLTAPPSAMILEDKKTQSAEAKSMVAQVTEIVSRSVEVKTIPSANDNCVPHCEQDEQPPKLLHISNETVLEMTESAMKVTPPVEAVGGDPDSDKICSKTPDE